MGNEKAKIHIRMHFLIIRLMSTTMLITLHPHTRLVRSYSKKHHQPKITWAQRYLSFQPFFPYVRALHIFLEKAHSVHYSRRQDKLHSHEYCVIPIMSPNVLLS